MNNWAGLTQELQRFLRLRTYPVAYKRLEKVVELEEIPRLRRLDHKVTFCQLPTLVRRGGWTVGVTRDNIVSERCARMNGLADKEELSQEALNAAAIWFNKAEEVIKQMEACPIVPPGEALVLAPLASGKFDPDVILIYGNGAQLTLLMCALQYRDYERFQFFFIGEGACVDGLGQCYNSGKPALAIPCFGERRFGGVTEDELLLTLPPGMMEKAIEGLRALWDRGFRYPIMYFGPGCDPTAALFPALERQ